MKASVIVCALLGLYVGGFFCLREGFSPTNGYTHVTVPRDGRTRGWWSAVAIFYLPAGAVDERLTGRSYIVIDLRDANIDFD